MNSNKKVKRFYPRSRREWRNWLKKNHKKERQVAVIYYKKYTRKPSLSHREAMLEAICFGWIDTTANRLDEERYMVKFVKRNKNSKWSNNTLKYARDLLKQKLMSPEGIKFYKLGLSKPTHDHDLSENPRMPKDLKSELEKNKNKETKKKFEKLGRSHKKMYYRWIQRAKQEETRKRRIKNIIDSVSKDINYFRAA